MHLPEAKDWHFDVDNYLKPFISPNLVHKLPRPLSHFLGYRDKPQTEVGNILVAGWAFLGAFLGVAVMSAAFMAPAIKEHGVPLVIGSFVRLVSQNFLADDILTCTGCCSGTGVQYY